MTSICISVNLFICLHFETSSDREFIMLSLSLLFLSAISSFSFKQRLQRSEFLLIGAQWRMIFQVTFGCLLSRFNFHTTLESSVSFPYFSFLNDDLWLLNLSLNEFPVNPMYFNGSSLMLLVVISAS